MVLLCLVTRNKSICTTTLHSAMTVAMVCMEKSLPLEVQFHVDRSTLPKALKGTHEEKMLWIDYGVSIDKETIERLLFPTEKYKVLVVPCVLEGVDWKKFKDTTSGEPIHQRGLHFDTKAIVSPKSNIAEFVSSVHDGRVICFDVKHVNRKLHGLGGYKSLDHLKTALGIKIGVLRSANVTCHYVYECFGNIIESTGVRVTP